MQRSKVYFTNEIAPDTMIKMYDLLGVRPSGKIAVKLHSGEVGNQNFVRPDFLQPIIDYVQGVIVESNTAYSGKRSTTEEHWKTIKLHGWTDIAKVDIMDEEGDLELSIPDGICIKKNYVGSHMENYDFLLVLSHFKGHPMGGFGGALKNISIGMASSFGKAYIHGAGNPKEIWTSDHDSFLESMADASSSIMNYYKENIAFISIMNNMSVDCDCCEDAEDPKITDIGILSSLDPVALDQACIDLVYSSDDPGKKHLIERIESRNGIHTVESAAKLGVGTREYELIKVD